MRFSEQAVQPQKEKKEKPREMTKPGAYTSEQLTKAKKIITPHGGKR